MLKLLETVPSLETFKGYSISDDGRIFSHKTNKFLKPSIRMGNGCAYERIGLTDSNRVRKIFSIHRLVCIAFKYNPNHLNLTVNHIDENTFNNRIENLEWLTMGENIRYSKANKTYVGDPDKLTTEFNEGDYTVQEFAEKYNTPLNTMWDILNKLGSIQNNRKRRVFDKELRLEIALMRKSGKSLKEVAKYFNCSESMVSKVFDEYERGVFSDHT
jgi:Mor family transcriptional regulator